MKRFILAGLLAAGQIQLSGMANHALAFPPASAFNTAAAASGEPAFRPSHRLSPAAPTTSAAATTSANKTPSASAQKPAAWGLPYVSRTPIGWRVAGQSLEGRPILAVSYGAGPRRVMVIGPFSGLEPDGVAAAELLAAHLQKRPPTGVMVTVVRDVNPDGHVRMMAGNARGVNLERDFAASTPPPALHTINDKTKPAGAFRQRQTETDQLIAIIETVRPDRIVLLATAPAKSKSTVGYAGDVEDLARQITLETDGHLTVAETNADTLAGYCWQTYGVPVVRIGLLPGVTAEQIWQRHQPALLTAAGCGTQMKLDAVTWRERPIAINATPIAIGASANGYSAGIQGGASSLAPSSPGLYQQGGGNDDGAPPMRFSDIQYGVPVVPITRATSAPPQPPIGATAAPVAVAPAQPPIPLNPATTPVPTINPYRQIDPGGTRPIIPAR